MNLSTRLVLLASILILKSDQTCLADVPLNGLTEAEKRGGWKLLFDGKTTAGWRNYRKRKMGSGWAVADGVLNRVGNGAGDIVTTEQFGNFEL